MIELRRRSEERHSRLEFGEDSCKYCFGGKSAPKAPDMSGMIAASEYSAELGFAVAMEQLSWAQQEWSDQKDLIYSVLDVQMPIMMEQWDIAKEQWANAKKDRARYEKVFQPLENKLIKEFESYSSPQRMELEAGRAAADVTRAFQAQRENAQRQLESYGIDPSQTRSQALDANMRAQEAAAQAGAENQARQRVEDIGRSLRAEAINIGRGMPSQVAGAYGQALQGGQGAAAIGQGAVGQYSGAYGTAANSMGNPTQWYGAGQSGIGQAANIANAQYANQLAGWQAGQQYSPWNAALNLGGTVLGGMATGGTGFFAAEGGAIEGPGGPKEDSINIRVSDGEYVIPAEVVERKGTEFFDRLVEKTREHPAVSKRRSDMQAQAMGYADGGAVPSQMQNRAQNRMQYLNQQYSQPAQRPVAIPANQNAMDNANANAAFNRTEMPWANSQRPENVGFNADRFGVPTPEQTGNRFMADPARMPIQYGVPDFIAPPQQVPEWAMARNRWNAPPIAAFAEGGSTNLRVPYWEGSQYGYTSSGAPATSTDEASGLRFPTRDNSVPFWGGRLPGSGGYNPYGSNLKIVDAPQMPQLPGPPPAPTSGGGYTPMAIPQGGTGAERWAAIRDARRGSNSGTDYQQRLQQIREWMKTSPNETWRQHMYNTTEPRDRKKAQEWMKANPGKTLEGDFKHNTWQYAVQQYMTKSPQGSIMSMYGSRYGINPRIQGYGV